MKFLHNCISNGIFVWMNLLARENEGKVHGKVHPRKNNLLFQKEEKLNIGDDFHAQNIICTECLAKT